MQERAVFQVAFPASVDLLVCRGHLMVPNPLSVSSESVIFYCCFTVSVCLKERVHLWFFTTIKTAHSGSGSKANTVQTVD